MNVLKWLLGKSGPRSTVRPNDLLHDIFFPLQISPEPRPLRAARCLLFQEPKILRRCINGDNRNY